MDIPATGARSGAAAGAETDAEAIERALALSRYARRVAQAEPGLFATLDLQRPFDPQAMREALQAAAPGDEAALARALRGLRKRVMLALIARDLAGRADLAEVVATMTALAEIVLEFALARLSAWAAVAYGEPVGAETGGVQRLIVVGMGKLGGGELNVSSDIDLVFLYPEDGETRGPQRIGNPEYFTRLARKLINALAGITADGQVFRVDVRLRPYGDSGPLVCSLPMLENYFITQGREWERYAWLKARPICGGACAGLESLVRPFVFRRHFDFVAVESLRELHREIQREVTRRDKADDIKLGRGGIREIEFIVQVFQLIRGGREAALRVKPTLAALDALGQRRLLPPEAVAALGGAYAFLRNLEHRLQYLDDQQTHRLPADAADRALIAQAMGCADVAALAAALEQHRAAVERQFAQIFATPDTPGEAHPLSRLWQQIDERDVAARSLRELGYREPESLLARLAAMRESSRYRQMPAASQTRLEALVPRAIEAATGCDDPDATLAGMLQLIDGISRREAYLALLTEHPQCLERVARVACASRWAIDYLTRQPILLDELLDTRALYAAPDWTALRTQVERELDAHDGDIEHQMDLLRHFKHAQTFRLLAQDLAGALPLETLSDHLSDLADLVLDQVLRRVWQGLRNRHRDTPRFAAIGYGKLGGKELGYASDLDLIFLYDDDAEEAQEVYGRFAQRINTWLSSLTPAGVLYETDLRLRPNGSSGLLVSPLAAFTRYQTESAWVWEHQALTRARFVAGDAALGARFEAVRKEVLCQPRDLERLRAEVRSMRERMLAAHPNRSGLFDLKHDRGGIIDVEFIVQYLVLGHAHRFPQLTGNIGNLALLKLCAELGLLDSARAEAARQAYRQFRILQHALRLRGEAFARTDRAAVAAHTGEVIELWREMVGEKQSKDEG